VDGALLSDFLVNENKSLEQFSAGFIAGRFHSKGWKWVDSVDTQNSNNFERGVFLTRLPFCREAWSRVERLPSEQRGIYWKNTGASPYQAEESDLPKAAELLLKFGRARAAVQCLRRLTHRKDIGPVELVIRVLQANLTSDEPVGNHDHQAILSLIRWLQNNPDTDTEQLFKIEWGYLPLLGRYRGGSPKTLARRLAQDPAYFCEVVRAVFRPRNQDGVKEEPSEERRRVAENAYKLLNEWRLPPGCNEQGQVDVDALNAWVSEVTKSTKASGHFEIAMTQLGKVFPYAPADPDGLWIHRAVAQILNTRGGEDLRSGYTCELYNMRGTHGFTGGQEELKIAARYRTNADAAEEAGFHRLADALRELAVSYEHDAERESKRSPFDD
jgi:hypothetical protein